MGFILSTAAESDLDAIWLGIAREASPETADRVIKTLTAHLALLGRYPRLGRTRSHDLSPEMRSFPAGEYIILYRIHEEDAVVTHVFRGSRDIERILREE